MYLTKQSPNTMIVSGKRTTPFGAQEDPTILQKLPNKIVVRVDTLACLKSLWGANILMARQHLYEMVSGTVSDEDFRDLITSYYKRYSAFANYVDEKYLFEDQDIPLLVRVINPAREAIKEYEKRIIAITRSHRGEFLGNDKDYVYVAFTHEGQVPNFEESKRVC